MAAAAADVRAGHLSPPHLDSVHPDLPRLAPHLVRPSLSLAVQYPTRIGTPAIVGRHCRSRSSAALVELPSPAVLRPNRVVGELPCDPLKLSELFPLRFRP